MDDVTPAPMMGQKRRTRAKLFGRNRSDSGDDSNYHGRTKSPEAWPAANMPVQGPRGARSNSNLDSTPRFDMFAKMNSENQSVSPEYGYGPKIGSPERVARARVDHDGGMF